MHLVGPGGAGKTTIGPLLASRVGARFMDLDAAFPCGAGAIPGFIARNGYMAYARKNIERYGSLVSGIDQPTVFALSSGFMTYPEDTTPDYSAIRARIADDALSILLLPSLDEEECARIIVARQLQRTYLEADAAREEARLRERFPLFMALRCKRILSKDDPRLVASRIVQALGSAFHAHRRQPET
ncbi:shikimate kinase [Uliginosibacterium sp. H1]|uniref:shikimate kinase n=1 Tax=Uliginosibacterium sp. H1 TaxID=3114757 RepID=UPI002E171ED7|nr:shikimate kinase [Uliginosibacterium sp. H1]